MCFSSLPAFASHKSVYQVVKHSEKEVGLTIDVHGFCVHSLRATSATKALAHNVQQFPVSLQVQ